jgi:hypothetical protein
VHSPELPCDWRPQTVESPTTGMPFTDREAWGYIAHLLEADEPWEEVLMEKPPGITGYVFRVRLFHGRPELYIKVHPLRNVIYGRSFHWSEY